MLCAMDLVPSLMELAGVASGSAEFDGESVIDILCGNSDASRRKPIYFRRPPDRDRFYGIDDCPDLAMREGQWKLLCEYDGTEALLFDLQADPSETNNLAGSHRDVLDRMTNALLTWHRSMPPDRGADFAN